MKLEDALSKIHVATPCHADWGQMDGDARARFCGQCQKHVYNLSAMSAETAAQLVREKEGKLCVRFYRRADGTMLHGEDCPVGLAARQWRRIKSCASAAASVVLLCLGVNKAQAGDNKIPRPPEGATMGKICLVPPPTPTPTPTPKPSPAP